MTEVLARLRGIDRRFGSVLALDGADLDLSPGEVHGVLGANGAGKTTLVNVLGGMLQPQGGVLEVGGSPVTLRGPRDAWRHGISLVHQHFTLVPAFSVLENLALGVGKSQESVRAEAEELQARTDLRVRLGAPVAQLGVGDRQRVEILKALLRRPRILVMDEPTAVLTPGEIVSLFSLLRDLASDGRAVVLVAHKIDEVLGVADRITVLRAGRTVLTGASRDHEAADLVRAMVGVDASDPIAIGMSSVNARPRRDLGPSVAEIENVSLGGDEGGPGLKDVSLSIGPGEVVGIAGIEGNGQREVALVLAGRLSVAKGKVRLPTGIGFIPQDRTKEGSISDFDLTENMALALQRQRQYRNRFSLRWGEIAQRAEEIRDEYEIATPSIDVRVGMLSGGNQQRVVVGREIAMATDLLVAENPTRGLDVAAAAFVHGELRRLAEAGVGIALISTDLDEVLALSDRIFAMTRGRLSEVPDDLRTHEGVGERMLKSDVANA